MLHVIEEMTDIYMVIDRKALYILLDNDCYTKGFHEQSIYTGQTD